MSVDEMLNSQDSTSSVHRDSLIESVLPNLRDLSESSGLHSVMKRGVLYRSARPFAGCTKVAKRVLCDMLNIISIVDLRDDDLSAVPGENLSRTLISQVYTIEPCLTTTQILKKNFLDNSVSQPDLYDIPPYLSLLALSKTAQSKKDSSSKNDSLSMNPVHSPPLYYTSPQTEKVKDEQGGILHTSESLGRMDLRYEDTPVDACYPVLKKEKTMENSQVMVSTSIEEPEGPLPCSQKHSFSSTLAYERQIRRLFIVNILNSPQVHARVMETVSRSFTLPLFFAYKVADKLTGTSFAPYYFCKYFIASRAILDSYIEMCNHCGENFCKALKVITLAPIPVLFHCTLGKDRTGILSILLLSVLGAPDEAIVHDYVLTECADESFSRYRYSFVVQVSGLSEHFMYAHPETCWGTLRFMRETWGSVDGYLDWIGFTLCWREALRKKFFLSDHHC